MANLVQQFLRLRPYFPGTNRFGPQKQPPGGVCNRLGRGYPQIPGQKNPSNEWKAPRYRLCLIGTSPALGVWTLGENRDRHRKELGLGPRDGTRYCGASPRFHQPTPAIQFRLRKAGTHATTAFSARRDCSRRRGAEEEKEPRMDTDKHRWVSLQPFAPPATCTPTAEE